MSAIIRKYSGLGVIIFSTGNIRLVLCARHIIFLSDKPEISNKGKEKMNRRKFIGKAAVGAGALSAVQNVLSKDANEVETMRFETPKTTLEGEMIYRTLGATGEKVSAIGLGGFHLSKPKTDDETVKLIRTAIDRGMTFMDN